MADEREVAFVKTFVSGIADQPKAYDDDFQPPLEEYMHRVPVLPVRVLCSHL